MSEVKLSDANKIKCDMLKRAGITVSNYTFNNRVIYTVAIKDIPNADDFIETRFNSINDILKAFADILMSHNCRVVVA